MFKLKKNVGKVIILCGTSSILLSLEKEKLGGIKSIRNFNYRLPETSLILPRIYLKVYCHNQRTNFSRRVKTMQHNN